MKPRIALCFSGQTRHINEHPMFLDQYKEVISLFSDFDIDFFGHTWSDQPKPHPDFLDGYDKFIQTDQEEIWNAVNTESTYASQRMFWNYLPNKSSWYDNNEFKSMLKGHGNFLQWARDVIKGTLGQIWSAHECFKLVEQSGKDYHYVVRLRWDTMIQLRKHISAELDDAGIEYIYSPENRKHDKDLIQLMEAFRTTLREITYNNRLPDTRSQRMDVLDNWDVLSTECNLMPSNNGMVYVNDHLFVIKGESFMKSGIGLKDPIELLDKIVVKGDVVAPYQVGFNSSHTLWMEWLFTCGFNVMPALLDVTTANGSMSKKENKKWNI